MAYYMAGTDYYSPELPAYGASDSLTWCEHWHQTPEEAGSCAMVWRETLRGQNPNAGFPPTVWVNAFDPERRGLNESERKALMTASSGPLNPFD